MGLWRWLGRPGLFLLPPERAHYLGMGAFSWLTQLPLAGRGFRACYGLSDPRLMTRCFGLDFPNPLGLAAGFDKNAQWFNSLALLGFGCIEIGSVTGQGQPGNPSPRLFRLPLDQAIINRMGFNNQGSSSIAGRLKKTAPARSDRQFVLGVNLGKTKVVPVEMAETDYSESLRALFPYADYFAINVSSPNTPGLRSLQDRQPLERLLQAVQVTNRQEANRHGQATKPILLKIAPDLTESQLDEIVDLTLEQGLQGIIATNTTLQREGLRTPNAIIEQIGAGGLSGRPLTQRSCQVVRHVYTRLQGRLPVIGVGGIFDGQDAWRMITHGADLIQLYTGFIYGGPGTAHRILRYLQRKLDHHRLDHISQAVGRIELASH